MLAAAAAWDGLAADLHSTATSYGSVTLGLLHPYLVCTEAGFDVDLVSESGTDGLNRYPSKTSS
jgi:putative intracellular protease/amidase